MNTLNLFTFCLFLAGVASFGLNALAYSISGPTAKLCKYVGVIVLASALAALLPYLAMSWHGGDWIEDGNLVGRLAAAFTLSCALVYQYATKSPDFEYWLLRAGVPLR